MRKISVLKLQNVALYLTLIVICLVSACESAPEVKSDPELVEQPVSLIEKQAVLDEEIKVEELPPPEMLSPNATVTLTHDEDQTEKNGGKKKQQPNDNLSQAVTDSVGHAIEAVNRGDSDGAVEIFETVLNDPQGGFLAAYNAGVLRERQGRYEEAAKNYTIALQANADFSPALTALVKLYLRQNRPSDAEEIARKMVQERPNNIENRVALARLDFSKERYETVIETMKYLLRRDETNTYVMELMAAANERLKRYELAKAILHRAIELSPNRAELYVLYATVSMELGEEKEAQVNLEKAIEILPSFAEARNNLGILYHRARDNKSAVNQYLVAIKNYPDYRNAYLNLGHAYKELQQYKDAELAYKKSIQIDSEFADGYFSLGTLYLEGNIDGIDDIGKYQKSIEYFNKYKEKNKMLSKDDPVEKYIAEARKAISDKEDLLRMQRDAQRDVVNDENTE